MNDLLWPSAGTLLFAAISSIGVTGCGDDDDGDPARDGSIAEDVRSPRNDGSRSDPDADTSRGEPDADMEIDAGELPDAMRADTGTTGEMRTSFFVTSSGSGERGGNYGGLEGADQHCRDLAANADLGDRTWHAYLSTSPFDGVGERVDARDRIGFGPWYNLDGDEIAANVDALHAAGIPAALILTELGETVPMEEHDILTGTDPDGRAFESFPDDPSAPAPTCRNWTSDLEADFVWVGHSDWTEDGDYRWSNAHVATCDAVGLRGNLGSGRLYCFAID